MSEPFQALVLDRSDDGQSVALQQLDEAALPEGDVRVAVEYSTLNYKDGLCVTGAAPIARTTPMVPGIDLAGIVTASDAPDWKPGDRVVVNGYGLSETHWGGYAQRARLRGEWLVRVPDGFTTRQAMAIGTGGYTAMLCVMALEDRGVRPGDGPVLVTGAAGGVGSVAIALLDQLGYRVVASTGRTEEAPYLKALGAGEVIARSELSEPSKRPLQKERFAGTVDSVGSHTLANALASTSYGGAVAACGLAQGADLPASVMPFILRGVSLVGVDSVMAPLELRRAAWQRLASDLDPERLERIGGTTLPLSGVQAAAAQILAGKIRGRVVVDVNS